MASGFKFRQEISVRVSQGCRAGLPTKLDDSRVPVQRHPDVPVDAGRNLEQRDQFLLVAQIRKIDADWPIVKR